jgi:predicted esterase YcpF (UPF0227 family)
MNTLNSTDTPLIVYFHGWKSNNKSEKIRALSEKYELIAPQIPEDFDEARSSIVKFIDANRENWNRMILVGTSLGGYWANRISNRLGMPAILINPSCRPKVTLGIDYPDIFPTGAAPKIVILATDDDVLDYRIAEKEFSSVAQIVKFDSGGHRFNRIDEISKYIDELHNHVVNFT